jgi:hypothetical protein
MDPGQAHRRLGVAELGCDRDEPLIEYAQAVLRRACLRHALPPVGHDQGDQRPPQPPTRTPAAPPRPCHAPRSHASAAAPDGATAPAPPPPARPARPAQPGSRPPARTRCATAAAARAHASSVATSGSPPHADRTAYRPGGPALTQVAANLGGGAGLGRGADCLRHRSGPRRTRRPRHRRQRDLARPAVPAAGTATRPRPRANQLRVVLLLHRSRRQYLARSGGHHVAPRPSLRRHLHPRRLCSEQSARSAASGKPLPRAPYTPLCSPVIKQLVIRSRSISGCSGVAEKPLQLAGVDDKRVRGRQPRQAWLATTSTEGDSDVLDLGRVRRGA